MYHFSVAYQKGLASDLVKYFAADENQDLGIVKLGMKGASRFCKWLKV